jgi:hypothetical protein
MGSFDQNAHVPIANTTTTKIRKPQHVQQRRNRKMQAAIKAAVPTDQMWQPAVQEWHHHAARPSPAMAQTLQARQKC